MSTKRSAIRGVALGWAGRVVSILVAFFVTPILFHSLGKTDYGIWSIIMSLSSYYAIGDLGMHAAVVKFVSQFRAEKDNEKVRRFVSTAYTCYALIALFVAVASVGFSFILPTIVEIPLDVQTATIVATITCGIAASIQMSNQVFLGTLKGLKQFERLAGIQIGMQVSQACLIVLVVSQGGGLLAMSAVVAGTTLFKAILIRVFAVRSIGSVRLGSIQRSEFSQLTRFGVGSVVINSCPKLARAAGPLLIGATISPAAAAVFAIADSLVTKAQRFNSAIGGVVMPVASELEATKRSEQMKRLLMEVPRITLSLACLGGIFLFIFGHDLVSLWIGEPAVADEAYPALIVLALNWFFAAIGAGVAPILTGCGYLQVQARVAVANGVLRLVLGLVLLVAMGDIVGMAIAILVPTAVLRGVLLPAYACKKFNIGFGEYTRAALMRPVLGLFPVAVYAMVLRYSIAPQSVVVLLIQMISVMLVALPVMFWACIDARMRRDVLSVIPIYRTRKAS